MTEPAGLTGADDGRRVAISITEGRSVRDLFYNGLLDDFLGAGHCVTVFTEAVTVPRFTEEWSRPGVEFAPLLPCEPTSQRSRAFWMRRRVARLGSRAALDAWLALEERRYYPVRREYVERFRSERPALLLTTHSHLHREGELIRAAKSLGIPVLGVVRSWDNVYKGIRSRPERLAVWNEINRREVIELEGYAPADVEVIGPAQFDPYFAPDTVWPRERLFDHFKLDPARPVIVFASPGYFHGIDETVWMDDLVAALDAGALEGRPQIICRLHPWSRLEHFQRYAAHPDVRLSHVERYWPALSWYMTRDDVVLVANMLRHADAVVTPASTITLEAAIFDRPTVVSIYHTYQPEAAGDFYGRAFGMHFKRIRELDLVPVVGRREDLAPSINRCLREPGWYREQRARMVRDYVTYTDGRSTRRLFDLAMRVASERRGANGNGSNGHRAKL